MRHNKRKHKLGVSGPHRSAMMGNLMTALITHGRIETTISKARALRPVIEKIITLAKKAEKANDAARKLHYRRLAITRIRDKNAVAKLFDELVSEFTDRNGGYTRIYKLGQRIGDAAEMGLIEFVDGNDEGYSKKPKKKATKKKAPKEAVKEAVTEEPAEESAPSEVVPSESAEEVPAKKAAKKPAKKAAKRVAKKPAKNAAKNAAKKVAKKTDDRTEKDA
ncbi:MAG: 50S ribosomal protein L17 [Verrucomicrobiota bacterium]|nr:50S ribosomal protein L17 [Verrucomicrobiota bacterium]